VELDRLVSDEHPKHKAIGQVKKSNEGNKKKKKKKKKKPVPTFFLDLHSRQNLPKH
jgi:hypothetical protein